MSMKMTWWTACLVAIVGCGGGSCPDGFIREGGTCVAVQDAGDVGADSMLDAFSDADVVFDVSSTVPADGATDAEPTATIQIQLTAPVDTATLTDAVSLVAEGREIIGEVALGTDPSIVTFTPESRFDLEATVEVVVSATLGSTTGATLGEARTFSFQVREGQWREPVLLETRSDPPEALGLDVDGSGNAFATWIQGDVSWAAHHDASLGWSDAVTINDDFETLGFVRTAFDPSGNAWAIWIGGDEVVYSSRYIAGTGFGAPEELGSRGNGLATILADDDANAIAIWPASNTRAKRYRRGVGWGAVQNVGSASAFVAIAADDDGELMAIWGPDIAAARTTGGAWGASSNLDASGTRPLVTFTSGTFTATWLRGTDIYGAQYDGDWSTPDMVASGARRHLLGAAEIPLAVWSDDEDRIFASSFTAGIGWSEPVQVGTGAFPQLATTGGDAHLVFVSTDGSVFTARRTDGWSTPELLAEGGAVQASIGVDDTGRVLAAYLQSDGAFVNVWARVFD